MKFHRCATKYRDEPVLDIKLGGFADASLKAYAAVIYLQRPLPNETYVSFLTAKIRDTKPG